MCQSVEKKRGKKKRRARNIFDEITSIEKEHFLGEYFLRRSFAGARKKNSRGIRIGSMARSDVVPVIAVIPRFTAH